MNEQPTDSIINALIHDRKRDRFWRNLRFAFGSFILLILILSLIGLAISNKTDDEHLNPTKPYIAVVKLEGEVSTGSPFSARKSIPQIQNAFKDKKARAVVLLIDSPGGSPVNAS